MERQSADLSTTARSCHRYDSRRRPQRRRSVTIGAQCRGRISSQSPHRPQSLSTTRRRRAGRDQARAGHVRQRRRARALAQGRTPEVSHRPLARHCRNDSAAWNHAEGTFGCRQTEVSLRLGGSYGSERGQRPEVRSREKKDRRFTQLSNTASVSNLSALTSLRETSGTQCQEKFFTLRREGAKRTDTSNDGISVPNLSGFAPLRETSPIPWQP